jgi:hypothetical protein
MFTMDQLLFGGNAIMHFESTYFRGQAAGVVLVFHNNFRLGTHARGIHLHVLTTGRA